MPDAPAATPAVVGAPPPDASWYLLPPSTFYDPTRWEVRGGLLFEALNPDKGTSGINGEIVFPKFFSFNWFGWLPENVTPRFKLGGVFNTGRRTDFAYADAVWQIDYTQRIFGEAYFGATIHDQGLHYRGLQYTALGCRVLFHAGTNLGYRFDEHLSFMLTYDHSSTGQGLTGCTPNQSLNQFGGRFGYQF